MSFAQRPLGWLVLGILLVTAVRIGQLVLTDISLHFDEAQYWAWSRDLAWGYYSKPPLIAWIIAGVTALFGNDPWAVRLPAPVLHGLTSLVLASIAWHIWRDRALAALCGFSYLLLPGISVSSILISTDVPLLLCWSVALLAFWRLQAGQGGWLGGAVLLGVALGLGLLAKYAMAYFFLGLLTFAVWGRDKIDKPMLKALFLSAFVGFLLLAGNLWWNATSGWATLAHTADNANWGGVPFQPDQAAEFLAGQFGLFGPILLAFYGFGVVVAFRHGARDWQKLLIAFSLPILALMLGQALVSRAHANWAATAYPAATLLACWALYQQKSRVWLLASKAVHAAAAIGLLVIVTDIWRSDGLADMPLIDRGLGWRDVAVDLQEQASRHDAALIASERKVIAPLVYELARLGPDTAILQFPFERSPLSFYEMAFRAHLEDHDRWLFIASAAEKSVIHAFQQAGFTIIDEQEWAPAGGRPVRIVRFERADG